MKGSAGIEDPAKILYFWRSLPKLSCMM